MTIVGSQKNLSLTSNAKLAQSGKYKSGRQEVPGSIPAGGAFLN